MSNRSVKLRLNPKNDISVELKTKSNKSQKSTKKFDQTVRVSEDTLEKQLDEIDQQFAQNPLIPLDGVQLNVDIVDEDQFPDDEEEEILDYDDCELEEEVEQPEQIPDKLI